MGDLQSDMHKHTRDEPRVEQEGGVMRRKMPYNEGVGGYKRDDIYIKELQQELRNVEQELADLKVEHEEICENREMFIGMYYNLKQLVMEIKLSPVPLTKDEHIALIKQVEKLKQKVEGGDG